MNWEIETIFSIALSTDDIKPAPFTTVEFHINIKNDVFISKLIDKLAIRLKQSSVLSNIIDKVLAFLSTMIDNSSPVAP
ncbi:MAG TPA: hypothetical protein DF911_05055 [Erysipelotrichaceae bacterium]|nr:hypothetical protein [Erysipelotrichaceae bacterium]HCW55272.1 hypothetical protein [Erysipelotrichaceae bacterium]